MDKFNKITVGFVTQTFERTPDGNFILPSEYYVREGVDGSTRHSRAGFSPSQKMPRP